MSGLLSHSRLISHTATSSDARKNALFIERFGFAYRTPHPTPRQATKAMRFVGFIPS